MSTLMKLSKRAVDAPESSAASVTEALAAADLAVPGYRRAVAFCASELEPRLAALQARRTALVTGLGRTAATDDLTARAAALLTDDAIPKPDGALEPVRRDLAAVEDELRVVGRALELQRAVVARDHAAWSAHVCRALAPLHRSQVQATAAALRALSTALEPHASLLEALRNADVTFTSTLRPMVFPHDSMRLDDPTSSAALWMNDARDAGLLDD